MVNSRLGTLECKPIDGGVKFRTSATLDETDLKAAAFHIFHPNRSRVVYLWWFISIINWGKNSYRSSTGKTIGKWHILAIKILTSNLLNVGFSRFNAWNKTKQLRFLARPWCTEFYIIGTPYTSLDKQLLFHFGYF